MKQVKFANVDQVFTVVDAFLEASPDIRALFAVWDVPAMQAVAALRKRSQKLPMATVDLGNEAAIELAGNGLIKGIGAQKPYDLGTAVATATILSLVGHQLPPSTRYRGLPSRKKTLSRLTRSSGIPLRRPISLRRAGSYLLSDRELSRSVLTDARVQLAAIYADLGRLEEAHGNRARARG